MSREIRVKTNNSQKSMKILERTISGEDIHDLIHAIEELDKTTQTMKIVMDKIVGHLCQR